MTMAENIKAAKKCKTKTMRKARKVLYKNFDNHDAIEVPRTSLIPNDYDGVMGVPISFLDKYCPEQFEILGSLNSPRVNGKGIYKRSLIRHRRNEVEQDSQ
jgi:hypothetical protein